MQGSLLKFPFSLYQVSLCLSLRDMGLPLMNNILKKKKWQMLLVIVSSWDFEYKVSMHFSC